MPTVHVFDPALCCSTGVCGTTVDPALPAFAADLAWLAEQGVTVQRFNLAQQPGAFVADEAVRARLAEAGDEVLPVIVVDGRIAAEGGYPTRDVLAAIAGLRVLPLGAKLKPEVAGGSCCSPKSGCC